MEGGVALGCTIRVQRRKAHEKHWLDHRGSRQGGGRIMQRMGYSVETPGLQTLARRGRPSNPGRHRTGKEMEKRILSNGYLCTTECGQGR